MNGPQSKSWLFLHPDLDVPGGDAGLRVTSRGNIETVSGSRSVRQAILLLLSTIPGERVMRPDYGCHLNRLMFASNDDATAGLAMHYVRRALERWEPRIEILTLDAGAHPEVPHRLDVALAYRIRATLQTADLTFSMDLTGASY